MDEREDEASGTPVDLSGAPEELALSTTSDEPIVSTDRHRTTCTLVSNACATIVFHWGLPIWAAATGSVSDADAARQAQLNSDPDAQAQLNSDADAQAQLHSDAGPAIVLGTAAAVSLAIMSAAHRCANAFTRLGIRCASRIPRTSKL